MPRDSDIRATVQNYVDQLLELYEQTDPRGGEKTEDDKLWRARQAVQIWWYLHGELMVWAQSHIVGYCIAKNNPVIVDKLTRLFVDKISENSHELEFLGRHYPLNPHCEDIDAYIAIEEMVEDYHEEILTNEILREVIDELHMSTNANNSFWRFELQNALRALNDGEALALTKPSGGRKQGRPHLLKIWKGKALMQVHFRCGQGMKKYRALEEVGEAIGQSPETLRSWEKELMKSEYDANQMYCSELAGRFGDKLDDILKTDEAHEYGMYRNNLNIFLAQHLLHTETIPSLDKIREKIKEYRSLGKNGE
jgi:hypothetical protein